LREASKSIDEFAYFAQKRLRCDPYHVRACRNPSADVDRGTLVVGPAVPVDAEEPAPVH
jgi:hypothetical protein